MWTHAVLLFALCLGFYVRGETFCEDGLLKACPTWFSSKPSFPKTEEDVLDICPKILSHVECVQNFVADCGEDVADAESLSKFKIYVTDVCKKDSKTRADIVKELPCMKDALGKSNGTCLQAAGEAIGNYIEENDPDFRDSPDHSKYECFYMTVRSACIAAEFDVSCGTGAKDILLDAVLRTGFFDGVCQKDETDELLQLVAVLELELAQKERISSVLNAYREFSGLDEVPENRYKRHVRRSPRRIMDLLNKNAFQ